MGYHNRWTIVIPRQSTGSFITTCDMQIPIQLLYMPCSAEIPKLFGLSGNHTLYTCSCYNIL